MSGEYFKKRSGTTDRGKNYEDLFIANIVLDFILDDSIQDFKMSANDANFGAFDDIVLSVIWTDQHAQDLYGLQLKHSDRALSLQNLVGKSGEFSIKKYHENFVKLKQSGYKWVLLTNREFKYNEKEAKIRIDGDDFDVKIVKFDDATRFLKFCSQRCFYQFQTLKTKDKDQDTYDNFFRQFFLVTNQLDVFQIEVEVIDKFKKAFSCDEKIFRDYYKFITDWSLKEGKKVKLDKLFMKQVVAIQILSPFIKTINCCNLLQHTKAKSELLQKVMSTSQITYCQERHFDTMAKIFGNSLQTFKEDPNNLRDVSIMGLRHQVISVGLQDLKTLSDHQCYVIQWILNRSHLVVVENDSVTKALALCKHKRFVILSQSDSHNRLPSLFFHLSDVKTDEFLEEITNNFTCLFQGKKEITLNALLGLSDEIQPLLTINHLLRAVEQPLDIGEEREELPTPYIPRSVTRLVVDFKLLSTTNYNTVIIVSGLRIVIEKHIAADVNILDIEELLIVAPASRKNVYTCDECLSKLFNDICNKYPSLKCHHFRIDLDENLEWVRSKGGVTDLRKFLTSNSFIEELKLLKLEEDNNLNVICADAGMGKTTLLKSLKNSYSPEFWTLLIYPKDHSKYFRENGSDVDKFMNYIFERSASKLDDLSRDLLMVLYKKGRVNFFWDALDETSDENLKIILKLVEELRARGYKQWLTSRANLAPLLEEKFSILTRTIRQFDEEDQKTYIQHRLQCSDDELDDIFQKINKHVQLHRHNNILGIALQIYMFTGLLLTNSKKYTVLLEKILSLADLYECFVEEKFNLLHTEKENFDGWNDMVYKRNKKFKKDRLKSYEEVAIKLYFPALFATLGLQCEEFLEEMKTEDSVGIITRVSDDDLPDFWHNSYGEYFAAVFLSGHLEALPNIIKFFFEKKYTNIRFFFDLIVAKECPAHISVLYQNFLALKNCEEGQVNKEDKIEQIKDKLGRNPLQLACSWGEQYSDLLPQKSSKWGIFNVKFQVYRIFAESVKRDTSEFYAIIEALMEKNDPLERDNLGLDAFSYADLSHCLTPLNILARKYKIPFNTFNNFKDVGSVVYYACFFDLSDLLPKDLPVVEDEFQKSVLFTAVENGSINVLKKLSKSPYYNSIMASHKDELLKTTFQNKRFKVAEFLLDANPFGTDYLNTLLLANCDSPTDFIKLLVNHGADVNTSNEEGHTPLYLSGLNQSYENALFLVNKGAHVQPNALLRCCGEDPQITELLINNGADVDAANSDGTTPILHASKYSHFETVKVLIDRGARLDDGDDWGCRPIHYACVNGRYDVVLKLIDAGADKNVKNDLGVAPLHYCCGQQRLELVELLVARGVIIDVADSDGKTPLEYALSKGNAKMVEVLKSGLDRSS